MPNDDKPLDPSAQLAKYRANINRTIERMRAEQGGAAANDAPAVTPPKPGSVDLTLALVDDLWNLVANHLDEHHPSPSLHDGLSLTATLLDVAAVNFASAGSERARQSLVLDEEQFVGLARHAYQQAKKRMSEG